MNSTILFQRWTLLLLGAMIVIMQCEPSQKNDGRDLMNLISRHGIKQRNLLKRTHKSRHQRRSRKKPKRNQRRKNKKPQRTRKNRKHSKHRQRKPTKKRRNQRLGKSNSVFEGVNCEWIDLCGLKSRAGNCSNGNKAVLKNAKGARKQFLIVGGKVLYGFVKKGTKFPACQGVTERTSTVSCKRVDKSDVAGIQLRSVKSTKKNKKFKHRKRQAYAGKECEYVDLCSMTSRGQNCVDGTKFVLKASGGVRKQFLITNNKLILAFVKRGSQFADCQTFTDVTASVTCKAVSGLSGFSLTGSSASTTTTTTVAGPSMGNLLLPIQNQPSSSSRSSTLRPTECTCGQNKIGPTNRIVGGTQAEINEYPWMVALAYRKKKKIKFFCGGSLISSRWVITAAHCLMGSKTRFSTTVAIVGAHSNKRTQVRDQRTVLGLSKIVIHPNFGREEDDYEYAYDYRNQRGVEASNDIGMVQLASAVNMNIFTPICLPPPEEDYTGRMGWVIGWGIQKKNSDRDETKSNEDTDETQGKGDRDETQGNEDRDETQGNEEWLNLQELHIPIINNSLCEKALEEWAYDYNWPPIEILEGMMCAGGVEGQDACTGDNGGPLSYDEDGQHHLVGIVSWGFGCANEGLYRVFTEVAKYKNWIETQIKENGGDLFCDK